MLAIIYCNFVNMHFDFINYDYLNSRIEFVSLDIDVIISLRSLITSYIKTNNYIFN